MGHLRLGLLQFEVVRLHRLSHLKILPACQPAEQGRDNARDTNDGDGWRVHHVVT
jgi:hypothetical protein